MEQPETVEALLNNAYLLLSQGRFEDVLAVLDDALSMDFDHQEVLFALKCSAWWQDSLIRLEKRKNSFDCGDFFMERWKAFLAFTGRMDTVFDPAINAFRDFAFNEALEYFKSCSGETDGSDVELWIRMGVVQKGLGNYEAAIRHLEQAAKSRKEDPHLLSQLADIHDLTGDERASKALFREAFMLNPQKVELEIIESAIIHRLVETAEQNGYTGPEALEWVPVLGELLSVFTVKRELKNIEASKLRQSVYELETELSQDQSRRPFLLPRLINRYFWLIDHGIAKRDDKSSIDELLLKIKLLDANVYKQYIA